MVEILSMISKISLVLFVISFVFMVYYWFHHNIINVYREIKGKNIKYVDGNAEDKSRKLKSLIRDRTTSVLPINDKIDDSVTELMKEADETIILNEVPDSKEDETMHVKTEKQTVHNSASYVNDDTQALTAMEDETVVIAADERTTCLQDDQSETVLIKQQANENIYFIDEAVLIHTDEYIE